jgi:hypothetical protein
MCFSRFALVVAALSGVAMSTVGHGQQRTLQGPSCLFPESEDVTKPIAVGPDSIAKRVEVVQPLDAPIRILRVDFTGATLTMGGFFRFTHAYSLEVVNVTDQIASGIGPFVWVFSGNAEGAHHGGGEGPFNRVPLAPGERRVLRVADGKVTEDRIEIGDDVRVRVGIASASFDTCTWRNWQPLSPFGPGKLTRPDSLDGTTSVGMPVAQ